METRAHYVAVGAFVLAMVFLAFVAELWLAGTQFTTTFARYDIYFEGPVTGLTPGGRVEYNGIPVGTVSDIEIVTDQEVLKENGGKPIRVTVEIKNSVAIKKDAAASIQTNILSGVSFVLITPGKSEEPLVVQPGQRYPVIRSHRATLANLAARGPQLLDKVDEVLDHLNELLNDQNRQTFNKILDNIQTISANLAQHSDEIATNAGGALKAASALFNDVDTSYSAPDGLKDRLSASLGDLRTSLADFDKLVKDLDGTNRQIDSTLQDLRPGIRNFSQHTLGDVDALVSETRQFIAGLGRLANQLERDPSRLLFGDRREGYQPK